MDAVAVIKIQLICSHAPATRHLRWKVACHGQAHLILCDNMVTCCVLAKKESGQMVTHLVECKIMGARMLACNLCVSVRWIRSEHNPADEPITCTSVGAFPRHQLDSPGTHGRTLPSSRRRECSPALPITIRPAPGL